MCLLRLNVNVQWVVAALISHPLSQWSAVASTPRQRALPLAIAALSTRREYFQHWRYFRVAGVAAWPSRARTAALRSCANARFTLTAGSTSSGVLATLRVSLSFAWAGSGDLPALPLPPGLTAVTTSTAGVR